MTSEEIKELKGLAASMGLYDDKNPCKRAVILGKAIKALEQESVLDEIRAEIKQLPYQRIFGNVGNYALLDVVVEIIDKYREGGSEN